MPRLRRPQGPLLVIAAATLWGTTGTAQALGPEGISPLTVATVRMAGGSILIAYAVVRGQAASLRSVATIPLAIAIAAMASSQPLFFTGVARTGVGIGTVVTIGAGPIIAGLVAWAVRGEAVGARWVVATAVSLGGMLLIVSGGESAGVDPVGLGFALAAGCAWAVYLVAAKSLFDRHPPVFVAGIVFAGAALLLAPWFAASDLGWLLSGSGLVVAVWLGLVSSAGSYVLFAKGLSNTRVAVAATLSLAEPVTAAVLGIAVLGEPAQASTVFGAGLVAVGLLLLSKEGPTG